MKKKQLTQEVKDYIEENTELCGSDNIFYAEVERISTKYTDIDEIAIERYLQTLINQSDEKSEPYRTGITNIHYAILAVLDKLISHKGYPVKTADIYNIDTEHIHQIIEKHVQLIKTLNKDKRKILQDERHKLFEEDAIKHKKKIESLDKHIERLKDSKKKNKLDVFKDDTSKAKRDAIEKALKFLSVYNVIKYITPNCYILNMDHWFNYQRFSLNNKRLLTEVMPLLASFLKYNAPNRVDDFLGHMDKIVSFTLRAPKNHAEFANIENHILKLVEDDTSTLSFKLKDTDSSLNNKIDFEDVDTLQIIFEKDDKKYLKFKDKGTYYQVAIEHIEYLKVTDKALNSVYWKDTKCFVIFNDMYEHKHEKYKERKKSNASTVDTNYSKEYIDVIFEAKTNMDSFFDMHVLKNTIIYKEEDEKRSFIIKMINEIGEVMDLDYRNKIYITGKGSKDDILSYAQRSGTDIKLLHPQYLVKELQKVIAECQLMYSKE